MGYVIAESAGLYLAGSSPHFWTPPQNPPTRTLLGVFPMESSPPTHGKPLTLSLHRSSLSHHQSALDFTKTHYPEHYHRQAAAIYLQLLRYQRTPWITISVQANPLMLRLTFQHQRTRHQQTLIIHRPTEFATLDLAVMTIPPWLPWSHWQPYFVVTLHRENLFQRYPYLPSTPIPGSLYATIAEAFPPFYHQYLYDSSGQRRHIHQTDLAFYHTMLLPPRGHIEVLETDLTKSLASHS